jgi:TolB protein
VRRLLLTLSVLAVLLAQAGAANSTSGYRERLTFNEVGLKGSKRVLSRHDILPEISSLSPDHKQLAYVPHLYDGARSRELRIADVRTPRERLLVQAPGSILGVAWAPNGRTIALGIRPPEGSPAVDGIWLVEVDGSNLRRVADGTGGISWSPDSRQLAYARYGIPGLLIAVLDVATGRARDLGQGLGPSFSPNGRKIVYEEQCYHCLPSRIMVASVSSGAPRPLVLGFSPSWSPDGRQIAYLRNRGGKQQLWLVRSSGGRPRFLADRATYGVWSPDGRRIAFKRQVHESCRYSVHVIPSKGGSTRRLAVETRFVVPLAWNRTRLLYQATKC